MKSFSALFLYVMTFGILIPAYGQGTNVFNCASGFTSTGACGVGSGQNLNTVGEAALSGSDILLIPASATHVSAALIYQTVVNVQAFTTTFTFVPDGQNVALLIQNSNNNPGYDGTDFSGGAGCEGGFYQAFAANAPPNNVFALEFDSYSYLNSSETFTYSSAQIYQMAQSPCNPNDSGPNYWLTNKISTSPVPLDSPSGSQGTTTGDTYSATVSYDGSNFNVCLYDVTAANGSCSSGTSGTGTYFQQTWSDVNIPSMVDGNTALVGLVGATGESFPYPLYIDSFVYTVNSAPSAPSLSTYTTTTAGGANGNYAATPTFSPSPGTYSSTQSVTLSSSTPGNNICYITATSLTSTTLMPWPNSEGGCIVGTLYSGAISVTSTQTIYAVAGTTYTGVPSAVTLAAYTIGGSQANAPTFSPGAGTYPGTQSVTVSTTSSGAIICTNTTGSPVTNGSTGCTSGTLYSGPITVSSNETLYAVAGGTGYSDSPVDNSSYVIQPTVSTPTFSPPEGAYTSAQSVSISDATSGATIYYTTNGTTPTISSTRYSGPITVSVTETLEAIAVDTGDTNSAVASAAYSINSAPPPTVATPTFSPAAGTYTAAQSVTLSDTTSGASIYYTTNGTTPTTSSTPYSGPITVSSTETLEAIAVETGDTNSAVASAAYTINSAPPPTVATPTFSPAAGTYTAAQSVTLSDTTSGASIYYTTNGTTPTTSSTPYSGPITVSSTETLEAIAVETGDTNSAVASAAYTINSAPPPTVATPTFSPAEGAYASAQPVTLSDTTSGATIYYTTNGTTPTTSSTPYSGPITVSSTETLEAIAVETGDTDSAVASAAYTINSAPSTLPTPTFSPAAGAYTTAQSVTLSDATSGASIYYTTNGTTPTISSTRYSGPITVSATETLEAIAVDTGDTNSAVASAAYTINSTPPTVSTPTFSPAEGAYASAQSVTLSDTTSGATIYYTTNGTTPTTSSTRYSGPITVSATETLEAIAVDTGDTNSAVASAAYTINSAPSTLPTPTFSPAAGAYTTAQSVTLSDATSGASIYYTTNGTTPTTSSTPYSGPITVSATETLEAIAVDTGDTNSAVASAAYTINSAPSTLPTPTFSPAAGTYTTAQSITISDTTSGATIYYTTNGTMPTISSTRYSGPITVSVTETLEAIAVDTGDTNSAVASAAYTINSEPPPTVATPTFSPAAGTYTTAQWVTISDTTSGASIYYTTNGTTPTISSTRYSGPITVSSTETLEAIAVETGDTNSAVASAAYTIAATLPAVATPTFSPAAGAYTAAQSVTISDTTSGASIYYTTNGTTPTTSSTPYSGPITVSSTETLEAIAVETGDTNSAVASAAYTINSQPNFVLTASSASLSIISGDQGTLMLTLTPENGFNSPVSLACSGLPSGVTCDFEQQTVTLSDGAATTQLTISTSAPTSASQRKSRRILPLTALAMTICLFSWRKRRGAFQWLCLVFAFVSLGIFAGCGGVTLSGGGGSSNSTVTVTATSGSLQQSAEIALKVN